MTKKAIITTHDGREATIVTKASNVLFEDGQTAQDILNDRQDTMITPIITTSASMSKVGQGDSVDYSENVVDGAYESCVLKGNTKVNLIQESGSKDVVLPYEFAGGQYVTINDTKETGALGVELKGQTLVNLCPKGSGWLNQGAVMWYNKSIPNSLFKPNTKYFLKFNSDLSNILDSCYLGACTPVYNHKIYPSASGCYAIMTTNEAPDGGLLHVYPKSGIELNSTTLNENVRFVFTEYQEGMENWDIPYFEGMQSVEAPSVTTVGKNLLPNPKQAKNGAINGSSYSVTSDGIFTITGTATVNGGRLSLGTHDVFKLQEGVTYVFAMEKVGGDDSAPQPFFHLSSRVDNISRVAVANSSKTFTYSSKWGGLILGYNVSTGEIYNGTYRLSIVGENENRTYEPYKSTTLTLPEEITLRGIGNVKDTLNTVTGEYVQRIGEVVLDGSEDETIGKASDYGFADYVNSEYSAFRVSSSSMTNKHHELNDQKNIIKTDKFNVIASWLIHQGTPQEGITNYHDTAITISILKSKLTENTVAGFKQYLQQNPITVQYRLATPITKKLNLTFTDQDSAPTTKLSTYDTTTHINASSQEGSLIPTLSHVNPSYPVILKPSTKYSIVADSYSNDHTNSPIDFDLGGATVSTTVGNRVSTVTTPSTLTSEKLVMSGRGNKLNNVMVVEGDVVGDEPYFEGMCDCKSPILSNVGKNLFDVENTILATGNINENNGANADATHLARTENYTFIPKGTITISNMAYGDHYLEKVVVYDLNKKFIKSEKIDFGTTSKQIIFENDSLVRLTFRDNKGSTLGSSPINSVKYMKVQLEESPTATTYEPYKSNILSVNGDKIELTEDMLEQGGFSAGGMELPTYEQCKTSTNNTIRMRSKELIKVSPNTTYIVVNKTLNLNYTTYTFNSSKRFTGEVSTTNALSFTTSPSCQYIAIMFSKGNNSTVVTSDFKESEFQIYEVDKTIVLRSLPSGVCDTLNVETGEYVQRIGEVVLDGSENWAFYGATGEGVTTTFKLSLTGHISAWIGGIGHCDRLKFVSGDYIYSTNNEGITTDANNFVIRVLNEKASTIEELKSYLKTKPLTTL